MYEQYQDACRRLVDAFGPSRAVLDLQPADFEQLRNAISKTLGLVCIHNTVTRIRSVFKFGVDQGLLPRLPTFGQSFRKPSQKALRVQRAKKGPKMFTAEQLRKILDVATPNMKGMVLLGINAALGNTDVAELPEELIDFAGGWLSYPRGKTGIDRRVPLWPETLAALREVIARRGAPENPQDAKLLFIGKRGENYLGDRRGYRVHQEFIRVLKLAGIEGRSFYDLRRTFETIAEGSRDLSAVQRIMGHSPPETDMSARYRQMVGDERLQDVANHVRAWLFGEPKQGTGTDAAGRAGDAQAAARRTALQAAIKKARQGIASAEGPTRRTLESVWLPDIQLAEEGDASAVRRLLDVWSGDDRNQDEDTNPGDEQDPRRFRVVG
jgi:integrase